MMKVKRGNVVVLKKEYRDDDETVFIAVDDEEKQRVTVVALVGMRINPTYVITSEMIESIELEFV